MADLGTEDIDEAAEKAFEDTREWLLDADRSWLHRVGSSRTTGSPTSCCS